jgi:hypothetical protein
MDADKTVQRRRGRSERRIGLKDKANDKATSTKGNEPKTAKCK